MQQIEVFADIWGSDGIPHTFIKVYHPDGTVGAYGLGPWHEHRFVDWGRIWNDAGHESNRSSGPIDISIDQYTALIGYINTSIAKGEARELNYNVFAGPHCTTWVRE